MYKLRSCGCLHLFAVLRVTYPTETSSTCPLAPANISEAVFGWHSDMSKSSSCLVIYTRYYSASPRRKPFW